MFQIHPTRILAILFIRCAFSFTPFYTISSRKVCAPFYPLRLSAGKEILNFIANIETASTPLDSVSTDVLTKFLRTTACRNHFLSAGGTSKCVQVSLTPELEDLWREVSIRYGPDMLPSEGDAVVIGESSLQFPGLKMVNNVYTGVKLVEKDQVPFYQFLLIGERRQVYGPPPLVWLYNQMTGSSVEQDDVIKAPTTTKALSKLLISEFAEGPCFSFVCNAEIIVEFPSLLLKILPASREKMEEQGSAAVTKAIERDVSKAINTVNDVFFEWMTQDSKVNVVNL